jgi:hypothetical protein
MQSWEHTCCYFASRSQANPKVEVEDMSILIKDFFQNYHNVHRPM